MKQNGENFNGRADTDKQIQQMCTCGWIMQEYRERMTKSIQQLREFSKDYFQFSVCLCAMYPFCFCLLHIKWVEKSKWLEGERKRWKKGDGEKSWNYLFCCYEMNMPGKMAENSLFFSLENFSIHFHDCFKLFFTLTRLATANSNKSTDTSQSSEVLRRADSWISTSDSMPMFSMSRPVL